MVDLGKLSVWVEGLDHPETATVDPAGHIWAGGEAGQIYAVVQGGTPEVVAETGGFILGIAPDAAGRLYACDLARKQVLRITPQERKVEVYSSGTVEHPMVTPNFAAFDAAGNLYVTDSGDWKRDNGRIYRIDSTGETELWDSRVSCFPNGCCLAADGEKLIVVETTARRLCSIAINSDGSSGTIEVLAEFGEAVVPDGVAATADGGYVVGCYRPDRLYVVSPTNNVRVLADDPEGTLLAAPTNLAFYGADMTDMVIANLGRWHLTHAKLGLVGVPLRYPDVR